jgi:hypothetical protein
VIAPVGSNGEDGPRSMIKPMSFWVLFHITVVPGLTQNRELPFAFGMLGVEDAAFAVRFTSTMHGLEGDPHVWANVHV